MKHSSPIWVSISIFVGIVISILALVRGPATGWFLAAAVLLWAGWLGIFWLRTHPRRARRQLAIPKKEPTASLLLLHVNQRITEKLNTVYPQATWSWAIADPERLVRDGGMGRLRIHGVPDAVTADVYLDLHGNLRCDLVTVLPMKSPQPEPLDPQVWYDVEGRKALEAIVDDLASRNHSALSVSENGEIHIRQDEQDAVAGTLPHFPGKSLWPGLLRILEHEGLAAKIADDRILLSW